MEGHKVDLFLDSGAFSAWTQGAAIDIEKYIQFIKDNKDYIDIYANLDVIGIGGKQPNIETAKATLTNQKIMEAAGLSPIPCYHFGEPIKYLEYYVKHYEYIALGVAGNSGIKLTQWLNDCFLNHICDSNGMPKVKVHGFAVTSVRVMIRYPWYSVDSTSWVVSSRMGGVFIPKWIKGDWSYITTPDKILMSARSPQNLKEKDSAIGNPDFSDSRDAEKGKHFSTLSQAEQERYLQYLEDKGYRMGVSVFKKVPQDYTLHHNEKWIGKKPTNKLDHREVEVIVEEGVCNVYQQRDELNIIYFRDLEASRPEWPWAFKTNIQRTIL